MSELDTTVQVRQDITLASISVLLSGLPDDCVLALLADLDRRAASWDFTIAAARFFTGEARKFDEINRYDDQAITRVGEFARQVDLVPNGGVILGVWTDPAAQAVQLTLDDLRRVLDLGTLGLAREGD